MRAVPNSTERFLNRLKIPTESFEPLVPCHHSYPDCRNGEYVLTGLEGDKPALSIVCCSEIRDPTWRWVESSVSDLKAAFTFVSCPNAPGFLRINLGRMIGSWRAVRLARKINASVVVAHGPTLAAWCCIFASILNCREVAIFAHSFNFTTLPGTFKKLIFTMVLGRAERFAVFSQMERALYANTFRLDIRKIDFVHWGVNPPSVKGEAIEIGDYVVSIGGNARDYHTLIGAARLMPETKFVVVARPENLIGLDIPQNVIVHTNLPLDVTMNILGHSKLLALPLVGSGVPCGHVTLVAAMHLGRPVVVTDSTGVADYIEDGVTGLTVKMGSAIELSNAIERLWRNEGLQKLLAKSGTAFAIAHCSEQSIARHFYNWVASRQKS
jgi:glycosyltransferase involved in cell wall biosynthesis